MSEAQDRCRELCKRYDAVILAAIAGLDSNDGTFERLMTEADSIQATLVAEFPDGPPDAIRDELWKQSAPVQAALDAAIAASKGARAN